MNLSLVVSTVSPSSTLLSEQGQRLRTEPGRRRSKQGAEMGLEPRPSPPNSGTFLNPGVHLEFAETHKAAWCMMCWSRLVTPGTIRTRLLCSWDSPGTNTGLGCHALLQGIFPTQGSNPCLLHLLNGQASSLPLAPPGKAICSGRQRDQQAM